MIWLRVTLTGFFLFAVVYFQFFFDLNDLIDEEGLQDQPSVHETANSLPGDSEKSNQ